jgi:methionyl-tRNA formyltransferase
MNKKKLKRILVATSFKKKKINSFFEKYKKKYLIIVKNTKVSEDKEYVLKNFKNFNFLISYANGMIFNDKILNHYSEEKRLNFHPSTPKYRGRDTQHFACYNSEKKFGATLHFLARKVDSGKIIDTVEFKVKKNSSHYEYQKISHKALHKLLVKNFTKIINEKLKPKKIKWSKKIYKRSNFLKKMEIKKNISTKELKLLIRSFYTYNKESLYFLHNNEKIYLF